MGIIITRSNRTQQPYAYAQIDWSNPLTRGLRLAWNGGTGVDHVRGPMIPNGTVVRGPSGPGVALLGNGSGHYRHSGTPAIITGDFSVVSLVRAKGVPWTFVCAFSDGVQWVSQISAYAYWTGTEVRFLLSGGGDVGVGALSSDVVMVGVSVKNGVTNGTTRWLDRSKVVNTATYTPLSGATDPTVGYTYADGAAVGAGNDTIIQLVYDRALDDAEYLALQSNIWQVFAPVPRRSYSLHTTVQLLRPASDISAGAWTPSTGTTLYGVIDESTPDDNDYMLTTTNSTAEIKFSPGSTPSAGDITIRYRAKNNGTGALTAYLYQGATLKATHNPTLTSSYQTFTWTLTSGEASSITDFTDLRVRFTSS